NDVTMQDDAFNDFRKYEITTRLKEDIIYILGSLKAEQAISLLVDLMVGKLGHEPQITPPKNLVTTEMVALVKIGSSAVQNIIEALQNAKIIAETASFP